MKFRILTIILLFSLGCFSQENEIKFIPVYHSSFVITSKTNTIFVDPASDMSKYKDFPNPQLILITHSHDDHFNIELVKSFIESGVAVAGPKSVIDKLGSGILMNNGDKRNLIPQIEVEAIPMYNTTRGRTSFHPRGFGNGYIVTINGEKIYISGDTEDIPEILSLTDIDYAFICMNLPFTMSAEQAASAVLKFQPKNVYPYHYRGENGPANIEKFKELVSVNTEINVVLLKWY